MVSGQRFKGVGRSPSNERPDIDMNKEKISKNAQ